MAGVLVGEAELRLARARSALQKVEGRQGVRSYSRCTLMGPILSGVYEATGGAALLLTAMKEVFTDQSWMVLVGVTNFGWEAAQRSGIDLRRVIEVRCPPTQAAQVLSTLLEGFEVLVVGDIELTFPQQRTLTARARMLDRFILTTRYWPAVSSRMPTMDVVRGERAV